jgi:hypothetical protein
MFHMYVFLLSCKLAAIGGRIGVCGVGGHPSWFIDTVYH